MKKMIVSILVTVLACASLAGCGKKTSQPGQPQGNLSDAITSAGEIGLGNSEVEEQVTDTEPEEVQKDIEIKDWTDRRYLIDNITGIDLVPYTKGFIMSSFTVSTVELEKSPDASVFDDHPYIDDGVKLKSDMRLRIEEEDDTLNLYVNDEKWATLYKITLGEYQSLDSDFNIENGFEPVWNHSMEEVREFLESGDGSQGELQFHLIDPERSDDIIYIEIHNNKGKTVRNPLSCVLISSKENPHYQTLKEHVAFPWECYEFSDEISPEGDEVYAFWELWGFNTEEMVKNDDAVVKKLLELEGDEVNLWEFEDYLKKQQNGN